MKKYYEVNYASRCPAGTNYGLYKVVKACTQIYMINIYTYDELIKQLRKNPQFYILDDIGDETMNQYSYCGGRDGIEMFSINTNQFKVDHKLVEIR